MAPAGGYRRVDLVIDGALRKNAHSALRSPDRIGAVFDSAIPLVASWLTQGSGKGRNLAFCASRTLKFEAYSNHRVFKDREHRDDQ